MAVSSLSLTMACDRVFGMSDPQLDDLTAIGLLDESVRRRLYDWVVAQPEPEPEGEWQAILAWRCPPKQQQCLLL